MRIQEGDPADRVVLALHDLPHKHMLGYMARDLGARVHAVSVDMRLATAVGLNGMAHKFARWGVHRFFMDESFGVQDHEMVLDLANKHPEIGYITIDGTIGIMAMRRLAEAKNRNLGTRHVKLIATTDLPEIPDEDVAITFKQSVSELVDNLATQAQTAGLDGFYSSLREAGRGPDNFFWVASGVRLGQIEGDDKYRTVDLAEATNLPRQPDLYMIGSAVTHFYEYTETLTKFKEVLDQISVLEVDRAR